MKIKDKLDYSFNIIGNLGEFFRSAPTDVKIMLLGSIFPEKIQFDGKNYRTDHYNKMLDIIFQGTNTLRGNKKIGILLKRRRFQLCTPVGNRTQIVGTGIRNSIH